MYWYLFAWRGGRTPFGVPGSPVTTDAAIIRQRKCLVPGQWWDKTYALPFGLMGKHAIRLPPSPPV